MGCTLLTAFVHLCVLFSGILVHLVATLTGYVDILLNQIVFLESMSDNLLACNMASMRKINISSSCTHKSLAYHAHNESYLYFT